MARVCSVVAAALAAVGLTGWVIGNASLERGLDGLVTMKLYTAVALLLLSIGAFVAPRVGVLLAGIVGVVVVLVMLEYATGTDLHIDQLIVVDHNGGPHPGRMAFVTALALFLLAVSRLSIAAGRRRSAQITAFSVLLIAVLTLLGYAYGVRSLYRLDPLSTVALPTAIALFLLSIAALATVRGGLLVWAVAGGDAGATMVRRLLPLAMVGLPLLGYLCLLAERHQVVTGNATIALIVVACAVAVGLVTWRAASSVARVDRRRVRALRELTELKIDLERQVDERAEQLHKRSSEVAILEDRQRIAADLHDIVIQRLFAAGMFLQGTSAASTDPVFQNRLNTAVESMDLAIKDLRASIFELGGRSVRFIDLTTAIDDVCSDSARILGFDPDVTVDDADCDAEHVRDDVLAVLREALANVARHAQASSVEVVLRCAEGVLSLTVTDDGVGMRATTRSSGTRNIAERAGRRGGRCEWTAVQPHGTQLRWQVPVVAPLPR